MASAVPPVILDEMIAYYRARAAEYDQWWDRRGRYDRGEEHNRRWFQEREQVYAAFDAIPFAGHVLELAPGTGTWTRRLACRVATVTAIDVSPEMLELNRAKVPGENVRRLIANLFEWVPGRVYDGVVFGFWISHVPADQLAPFLRKVSHAVRANGQIFFVDGLKEPSSTAVDHVLPDQSQEVMSRKLNDGRAFRVVKKYHDLNVLTAACHGAGLDIAITSTSTYFYYGIGSQAGS